MAIRSKELFPMPPRAAENAKLRNVLYLAGGIGSGAVLLMGGTAHAHEESVDSDSAVVIDKNESVWGELAKRGYTPEQIAADLRNHGIKESEWATYKVDVGTIWHVSPEVLSKKTGTNSSSVTIVLGHGDTVWEEAVQAGVEEESIPELITWLEDTANMPLATKLPVGYSFTIPAQFLPRTVEIVPVGTSSGPDSDNPVQSTNTKDIPLETPTAPEVVTDEAPRQEDAVASYEQTSQHLPDVFSQDPNTTPQIEVVPAEREIISNPEVEAYRIILDSLYTNNGILTADAAARAYEFVTQLPRHPEGDPEFPYPDQFVKLPAPSVDVPFVVHPNTCAEELYALPSTILSTLMGIATYEWSLMLPENADKRLSVYEVGDLVSGDHRRHGDGTASDHRTRIITTAPDFLPDGFAFNRLTPNYDPEFTKNLLLLQLLARAPDGGYLLDHIEYDDPDVIKEVNGILFSMGRTDTPIVRVSGHAEHIHRKTRLIAGEDPNAFAGPNTTSACSYDYLTLDDSIAAGLLARRSSYPTAEAVSEVMVNEPVSEELPSDPTLTEEAPESARLAYWLLAPDFEEKIRQTNMSESRKEYLIMITKIVMQKYNEGAQIPPLSTIAMAMWEGGWGEGSGVREGNNPLSHKVSPEWAAENPDDVVWIVDDEYDEYGNEKASSFRKYPSIEAAIDAHIELITNSRYGQYEDAEKCRMDDRLFLEGLINELRRDCTIGRVKGEEGVLSYATGKDYVDKVYGLITDTVIREIIVMNPDEAQRQATKEWADMYAA